MLILALDCSTSRGSVAVGRAGPNGSGVAVLWDRVFPAGRGHGGELFSTLEEAMQAAAADGAVMPGIEAIIVGLGPGSYSGVRQSIAVATGLAFTTGARLTGVPSTAALKTDHAACHVIGDARRGTFYYTAMEGGLILEGPELLESSELLLARLALRPGWPVVAVESVPSALPAEVEAAVTFPLAARLLTADSSLHQGGALEPIYLRPPAVTLPKGKR